MSGGMSANWRAPTVGIMGNGGMRNPSDHASKPMQEIIKTVIEERIVEKFVDRPVYVVSEEMYKTLVEIAQRLDGMEKRQFEYEKKMEAYQADMSKYLDQVADEYAQTLNGVKAANDLVHARIDRACEMIEEHAKHPKTLWEWMKLWVA